MSRGAGRIERAIEEVLGGARPDETFTTSEIACRVYGYVEVVSRRHASVIPTGNGVVQRGATGISVTAANEYSTIAAARTRTNSSGGTHIDVQPIKRCNNRPENAMPSFITLEVPSASGEVVEAMLCAPTFAGS